MPIPNKKQQKNSLSLRIWMRGFSFASALATKKYLRFPTQILMRMFAWQSLLLKGGRKQSSLQDVALEWQRMFPLKSINKIVSMTDDTVYAEIHIQCPLRGTGDVVACYRLMEYDRAMLRKIGGQLIVLRSQAEPGVTVCKVALRLAGSKTNDLIPAHARA